MTYTITINASTPEELSAILAKLHTTEVQAPAVTQPAPYAVQDQPNYQQHQAIAPQAIAPTVSPQSMQPGFTPDPSTQYQQPYQTPVQQGYQQQPGQAPMQQQPGQVPIASAPTYTMEQLGVAASPIIDAGRSPELLTWINQRGAAALSQLDKSHYGDFATYLRSLGAKI